MAAFLYAVLILIYVATTEEFGCNDKNKDVLIKNDAKVIAKKGQYECKNITINGTLTIEDNVHIKANRILVNEGGSLLIGTDEEGGGADSVTIYLFHEMGYNHVTYGKKYPNKKIIIDANPELAPKVPQGQLMSHGTTKIYGKKKTPWTLLNKDASAGSTQISVDECGGWNVGDEIVVVTTGGKLLLPDLASARQSESFDSESAKIIKPVPRQNADGSGCEVNIDTALKYLHRGKANGPVPTFAEVLNLNRSVRITGDVRQYDVDPVKGFQGISTRQGHTGVMQVDYARVDNCGRVRLGEYCLHFHYLGMCEDCRFVGNVVTNSNNKGITVHGTHRALVDHNIVYNHRGAFLYIEDGNEYENVISLKGVVNQDQDDYNDQAGFYVNSMTNHFIGNHVAGVASAFFVDVDDVVGNYGTKTGKALNKVCKQAMPPGTIKGNVFHNNPSWGMFFNNVYPTRVPTSENGFVTDWKDCIQWNMDKETDQSFNFVIEDHVEYMENFPLGAYELNDVTIKNYIVGMSQRGLYWKTYRRGVASGVFCDNCTFYQNHVDVLLSGGSAMVEFVNSTFVGVDEAGSKEPKVHVQINNACGQGVSLGGLCASHYVLGDTNTFVGDLEFSDLIFTDGVINKADALIFAKNNIYFDAEPGVTHPTFDLKECTQKQHKFDLVAQQWWECPETMGIRAVRIYSPNRGDLTVTTKDSKQYTIPFHGRGNHSNSVGDYLNGNAQLYANGMDAYTTKKCERILTKNEGGDTKKGQSVHFGPMDENTGYQPPNSPTDHPGCHHRVWSVGYTFLVKHDEEITLNLQPYGSDKPMYDSFTLEYSDPQMLPTSIELTVTGDKALAGGPCTIESTHPRTFITQYGPYIAQTGAWWDCRKSQTKSANGWKTISNSMNESKEKFINQIPPILQYNHDKRNNINPPKYDLRGVNKSNPTLKGRCIPHDVKGQKRTDDTCPPRAAEPSNSPTSSTAQPSKSPIPHTSPPPAPKPGQTGKPTLPPGETANPTNAPGSTPAQSALNSGELDISTTLFIGILIATLILGWFQACLCHLCYRKWNGQNENEETED